MSLWEELVEAGFGVKEARLYLAVLESGQLTVRAAAEQSYVSRTTAYDVAKRLESQGLIQFVEIDSDEMGPKRRVVLRANEPRALLDDVDSKRQHLESVLPRLEAIRSDVGRPFVRYLEGPTGVESALSETLSWPSPIRGILSMSDLEITPGVEAMGHYIAQRQKYGLWLNVIRSREKEGTLGWPTSSKDLRTLRFAPPNHALPISILIGNTSVSILSSHRENFAMVVESHEYATLQRELFDVLWTISGSDRS